MFPAKKSLIRGLIFLWLLPQTLIAQTLCNCGLYDKYPWGISYYYGLTYSDALVRIVKGNLHRWPEHIESIGVSYTLSPENIVRKFFSSLVEVVQLNFDLTFRTGNDQHTIYEFDPYISFRWATWPWNNYVMTTFAIGEGISYVTSVPRLEQSDNENTKRLLNYLMFEVTFARPDFPRLQLFARIHHRSGAYGLYGANNTGSNDVGLGLSFLL